MFDAASDAPLSRVDFFIGGALVGNDTLAPYTFDWDTTGLTSVYEATSPPVRVTIK